MLRTTLAVLAAVACVASTGCASSSGTSCSVADNGDGTRTISCPDGTSAVVSDGRTGATGMTGPQGDAGTSCSVADNGDGTKTLRCTDGTSVTVSDGRTGDAGTTGAAGLQSLVALADEPAGANCPSGGTKVMSGLDANRDGVLQVPGEVQGTSYVCACGVIVGPVTVATAQDWQALVNAGCLRIAGSLTITTAAASFTGSPDLRSVSGDLNVLDNPNLTGLSLPSLTTVGGALQVVYNSALTSLSLPSLTSVAGKLRFGGCGGIVGTFLLDNPALTNLALPALRTVGSMEFNYRNSSTLTTLSLPALEAVNGDLTLGCSLAGGTGVFTNINLPALKSVSGMFYVRQLSNTNLGLPSLETVGVGIQVVGGQYTSLSLPVLKTVSGHFEFVSAIDLTSFQVPQLTAVGSMRLGGHHALARYQMPALATVGGELAILSNNTLTGLDFPVLRTVSGALTVTNNPLLRQCVVDALEAQLTTGPASYTATSNNGAPNTCP